MARLRLLTFNIAHARGASPIHQSLRPVATLRANLRRIANLITRLRVDMVALQEIDVSRGFSSQACVEILSGFENGGQRRARFLHS